MNLLKKRAKKSCQNLLKDKLIKQTFKKINKVGLRNCSKRHPDAGNIRLNFI